MKKIFSMAVLALVFNVNYGIPLDKKLEDTEIETCNNKETTAPFFVDTPLSPDHDAYLEGGNRRNNQQLKVDDTPSLTRISYMQFDLSGISGTISAVTLNLDVTDAGDGDVTVYLGGASSWTESNLSTSNAPTKGVQLGIVSGNFTLNQDVSISLNASQISAGTLNLVLEHSGDSDVWFASKDHATASRRPELVVTHSTGGGDNQAPTVPTGLSVSNITSSGADLNWNASTDNGGGSVAGYYIYDNGTQIANSTGTGTSYSLSALTASTSYQLTITAYDNASPVNESNPSNPSTNFTTSSGGGGGGGQWSTNSNGIHYNSGNVGIGNVDPGSNKLKVGGNIRARDGISVENSGGNYLVSMNGQADGYITGRTTGLQQNFVIHSNGNSFFNGGNVGIGTTNPGSWKLAVNGSIRAKEVKVESGWADYVFKEDYELPSLEEVEKHIKEKGHLINIPSAEEVEANGVYLGEMNKLLLEKIEELTLYILEQDKQLKQLQAQLEELKP